MAISSLIVQSLFLDPRAKASSSSTIAAPAKRHPWDPSISHAVLAQHSHHHPQQLSTTAQQLEVPAHAVPSHGSSTSLGNPFSLVPAQPGPPAPCQCNSAGWDCRVLETSQFSLRPLTGYHSCFLDLPISGLPHLSLSFFQPFKVFYN